MHPIGFYLRPVSRDVSNSIQCPECKGTGQKRDQSPNDLNYCKEELIVSVIVGMGVVPQKVWWCGSAKPWCDCIQIGWVLDA